MSERDEFEAWWRDKWESAFSAMPGAMKHALKEVAEGAWQAARATPQQAVPALTVPVAWVDEKSEALIFGGWDKRPFSRRYKPVFFAARGESAQQAVPDGWKLVPVEPTREMWAAFNKLDDEMAAGSYDGTGCSFEQGWNCMLAAAPQPSQEPQKAPQRYQD